MNILPQRGESARKQRLIPSQRPIGESVRDRPAAVSRDVSIAKGIEAKVHESLRVGLDDRFIRGAGVVVVGAPSSWFMHTRI